MVASVSSTMAGPAMLAAAPQILHDELVPALTKLGVKNPEAIAESIAKLPQV